MRADTNNISGIINRHNTLCIPYFQRRYVWEKEDWKRFADDMSALYGGEHPYFLGAIILKNTGRGQFQVVDGQQRLTTFSIYMKVLHMLTNRNDEFCYNYLQSDDTKEPRLTHNHLDMPRFREIMHLETVREMNATGNIADAYNFFREYLNKTKNEGLNLSTLLNDVDRLATFVIITLDNDDDEQQIFDTINSLGVPLTTGELIKNFLYRSNDEDAYNANWRPVFDTDDANKFWNEDRAKSRQEKGSKNSNIEVFFHAFVRVKMWDFKDRLTEGQRKAFVKLSNVFSTCKAFVEKFGMNRQELANEIITYAKIFRTNFSMDILDERIPTVPCIERISCLVNATKSNAVIPYVLYIIKNVCDRKERNRIFEYIESYLVRRLLSNSSSNSYSELFAESLIMNRLQTYDSLKEFIEHKEDEANLAMPSDRKVTMNVTLRNSGIGESTARILFYLYETKIARSPEDAPIGGYNEYKAEPFMPKGKNALINWPRINNQQLEDHRQMLIGTLGNHFLVSSSGNKSLKQCSNETFNKKIVALKKWGEGIRCNNILGSLTQWTSDEINKRNEDLAESFCSIFHG